ncbi:MAG: tRNA (adenosine(37)-N6)-threonylcarbamoyltransferase complex ATPase subunit type 1 TsaE [Terrimicrobiaceae bacterium]
MANRNPICDRIFTGQGVVCASEEETRALGRELAVGIAADATLSLEGPLGAGKTCFVQGLAKGLGLDSAVVSSPTFTLIHEYSGGRVPLIHFDLYRLNSERELAGLGFEEYFQSPAIRAIEWGDKFPGALPAGTWRIGFHIEPGGRRIRGIR